MKVVSSQSACILLASSSLTVVTWRLLQWRARKRAQIAADRAEAMVKPGPLINTQDIAVCDNLINAAMRRASKWISYQVSAGGEVMIGQVGGVAVHKRPLLTLEPDYVMKPVQPDHRGVREIFLYEAVKAMSKNGSSQVYANLLTGSGGKKSQAQLNQQSLSSSFHSSQSLAPQNSKVLNSQTSTTSATPTTTQQSTVAPQKTNIIIEFWDTLAIWLAMKTHDPFVAEHEKNIKRSWKVIKKEVESLRRLATFAPAYYGVVGQRPLSDQEREQAQKMAEISKSRGANDTGTQALENFSLDAHLLLTDVTANFIQPCVMDIKMGTQSFEPDAPEDKIARESAKYPQQATFGFRIVGMRVYDPTHADADETGFRFFGKQYGRSLATAESIFEALRIYLSAGCATQPIEEVDANGDGKGTDTVNNTSTTTNGTTSEADLESQQLIRVRSLSNLLAQLRPIQGFFEENKSLKFYSSSLLLVYEGDRSASNPNVSSIKMIDFGRVRREPGGDEGYRHGLKTLHKFMDTILREEKARLKQQ